MFNIPKLLKRLTGTRVVASLALGIAVVAPALPAVAQDFPTKSVRIIVPYGPGTAPDAFARFAGDALQRRLGHPVLIDNRTSRWQDRHGSSSLRFARWLHIVPRQ